MARLTMQEFIEVINNLENMTRLCDRLNSDIRTTSNKMKYQFFDFTTPLEMMYDPSLIIFILKKMFDDDNDISEIEYFIYELDYGNKWKPGAITCSDGTDIKMQTAEDLYKILINK